MNTKAIQTPLHKQTHTLTSTHARKIQMNKMNKKWNEMLGPFLILSVHFFDDNSQQKSTEIES